MSSINIKHLSKRDAVALLEIIHSSTICADADAFKDLMHSMKKMISHDYCCAEYAAMGGDRIVETTRLLNVDFPWEYLGIYLRDNWREIDPIQKDVI